jgi:putative transposase
VSISELMGILKGKLAIKLFKSYPHLKQKPYLGNHFWSRGYFVNTVGLNEEMIRRYVHHQEEQDKKEENNGQHFSLFD